ncbi:hypothetical protein [Alteromonas macleodii]|uniref:Uncharacterized protein n=1 Tax=Alteromonas macleodii TaxID=28108 RepID=A0A6T9XZV8_ALTMA|nr:hypothetical protein [Alteromonas macleodii]CAB9493997.1 conserved protein of unknown function [Alteromonas macleodii]
MADTELNFPEQESTSPTSSGGSYANTEIAGKIADHIGTGKNAKDSFIWMTITWSFYIATGLSVLVFIRVFFSTTNTTDVLSSVGEIWGIFVPIITLALGYAFGKGE